MDRGRFPGALTRHRLLATAANSAAAAVAVVDERLSAASRGCSGIARRRRAVQRKDTANTGGSARWARAKAEATGILPLDYMLNVMRDAKADQKRRDAMAIAAAPYLHSKLSTIDAKLNGAAQPPKEVRSLQISFVRPRHANDGDEGEA